MMMQRWPVRVPRPYAQEGRGRRAAGHRHARHRHVLPAGQGRRGVHPGPVRRRQDRHPAPGRQVVQRAGRRLHRLRRARQRDDRRAHGVPRAHRPVLGRAAHEAHGARRQHLEHAGRRARGVRLHRHHDGRVLPRHGLRGRAPGRLHVALGRGDARDLRTPRRDARAKRASPPTSAPGSRRSTSGPARSSASEAPLEPGPPRGPPARRATHEPSTPTPAPGPPRPKRHLGPGRCRSSGRSRRRAATSPSRSCRTRCAS